MTEAKWLKSSDLQPMLSFIKDNLSNRKLKLFACACCRNIWDQLVEKRSKWALEVVERHIEGLENDEELERRARSVDRVDAKLSKDPKTAHRDEYYAALAVKLTTVPSFDDVKVEMLGEVDPILWTKNRRSFATLLPAFLTGNSALVSAASGRYCLLAG